MQDNITNKMDLPKFVIQSIWSQIHLHHSLPHLKDQTIDPD